MIHDLGGISHQVLGQKPRYSRAIELLEQMTEQERADICDVANAQKAKTIFESFCRNHHLRPSRTAWRNRRCVAVLWNEKCIGVRNKCPGCSAPQLDHAESFNDESGRPAARAYHLYSLRSGDLARLMALADEHDLDLWFHGESWYNPGHSFLVVLSRKDWLRRDASSITP